MLMDPNLMYTVSNKKIIIKYRDHSVKSYAWSSKKYASTWEPPPFVRRLTKPNSILTIRKSFYTSSNVSLKWNNS